jgi:hypothetical protein
MEKANEEQRPAIVRPPTTDRSIGLDKVIYVLHVFQKKSKRGIATSNRDINLITVRLREAARMHAGQQGAKR